MLLIRRLLIIVSTMFVSLLFRSVRRWIVFLTGEGRGSSSKRGYLLVFYSSMLFRFSIHKGEVNFTLEKRDQVYI